MLDRYGPVPLYRQIADVVCARIKSGELRPGDPIPSEVELSAEFGVARTTARRVARDLRDQGLVFTVQGEGTFVGDAGIPRGRRTIPLYQHIAARLAERIQKGEFPTNRAIPSEKKLMDEYGATKVTIRSAVRHLRDQGWVFTVAHRGTYVADPAQWPAPPENRP
ncbi:DNA-binding GntR family transcriptional regulator [Thermocatellispora tengchongensis]|uniref:DNA-binding GntR family transcriptional regulator n=1 Tax=Thermocatellispora tengchongensis TaxID=1073253 RepID=A0A840P2H8_9ACTN|nr:GntR family transcriptional regulator [Thermocatellispora tengchongensis]MBB5133189.1 DNA-binding GntR family transcriptional regulator [Thermocatellispora tengchongensis]